MSYRIGVGETRVFGERRYMKVADYPTLKQVMGAARKQRASGYLARVVKEYYLPSKKALRKASGNILRATKVKYSLWVHYPEEKRRYDHRGTLLPPQSISRGAL